MIVPHFFLGYEAISVDDRDNGYATSFTWLLKSINYAWEIVT